MEQESYAEGAAKVICELTGCSDALDVRVDGVYVKNEYLDEDLKQQVFTWIPACEMDWPGAPDPLTAPALTIPFSARNLAAFMLDGAGQGIQSTFGPIELSPDEDELSSLDMRATKVRKALQEAYSLAQHAQRVVGADNHDEQDRAADLLSAYRVLRAEAMVREQVTESAITNDEYLLRLARVHEQLAAQKAAAQKAKAEADTGHREWLKAMVNQLLNPALSATLGATPAPVGVVGGFGGVKTDEARQVVPAPAQVNSTKPKRGDSIVPVIELAKTMCRDPNDTNEVWPQMQVLADKEHPPFLASTENGLKYRKNNKDAYLTRDALDKRLHPEKRKGPAARR